MRKLGLREGRCFGHIHLCWQVAQQTLKHRGLCVKYRCHLQQFFLSPLCPRQSFVEGLGHTPRCPLSEELADQGKAPNIQGGSGCMFPRHASGKCCPLIWEGGSPDLVQCFRAELLKLFMVKDWILNFPICCGSMLL